MLILGIESSCDETAAAVVADGRTVLSDVIASSADIHRRFGGVVPEIASRMHVEAILPVVTQALSDAGCTLADITAVAVTYGPGLTGALLVGLSAAKGLCLAAGKPLIGVHHIAAHIAANYVADPELEPPYLCLVVSGGHSQLVLVRDYLDFVILGTTRDDAAGEAFDKVSRAVGLGYPGGPLIDKLAKKGNRTALHFPQTKFPDESLDFSFSGVKTAGLTFIRQSKQQAERMGLDWETAFPKADFVASYQEAILQALIHNAAEAIKRTGVKRLVIAGGVSANSRLREMASELANELKITFTCPSLRLCTDNAVMIGAMGYYKYLAKPQGDGMALNAYPHLTLAEFIRTTEA